MGAIGSTIAQGLAFGTGSSIAHRAVDAVMGPPTVQHEIVPSDPTSAPASALGNTAGSNSCMSHSKAFEDCLTHYGSDISKCQFYLDMLTECRKNTAMSV